MYYPEPITKLMDSFSKLPGIGPKTAARLAFFVLNMKDDDVMNFANALVHAKRDLTHCSVCGHITDQDPALFVRILAGMGLLFVLSRIRKML